jgi:abhydrolase domain-containing protein 6
MTVPANTLGRLQYQSSMRLLQQLSGARLHHAEVEGLRIPYLRGGTGQPLLLVHGFADAKETWLTATPQLSRHFDCIAVDLPGYGRAPAIPPQHATIRQQARFLSAFLDRLGLQRVHVAGNSMGGAIAARLATDAPERVRSVVLLAAAGPRGLHPHVEALAAQGDNPLLPRTQAEFDQLLQMSFAGKGPLLPRAAVRHLAHVWSARHDEHRAYFQTLLDAIDDDTQVDHVRGCPVPALLAYGRQERIIHLDNLHAFTAYFRRHEVWWIDDCGHAPHIERAIAVAKRMTAFLLQHGAA